MIKNGEVYFCDPCSASGEYADASTVVRQQDFVFESMDNPQPELMVHFTHDDFQEGDLRHSEDIGAVYAHNSLEAKRLQELEAVSDHDYEERRIGEAFCKRIGACTGMVLADGGPICPAFNRSELRRLL